MEPKDRYKREQEIKIRKALMYFTKTMERKLLEEKPVPEWTNISNKILLRDLEDSLDYLLRNIKHLKPHMIRQSTATIACLAMAISDNTRYIG